MKKTLTFFFAVLSLLHLTAREISLEESIEMANSRNNELLAQKSALESSDWGEKNALSNFMPKVSFNSTIVRIDEDSYDAANSVYQIPVFGSDGNPTGDFLPFSYSAVSGGVYKTSFINDITIQQPVFNGGKVIIGYQMSKLAKEKAIYSLKDKENDIEYRVALNFLSILKIKEVLELSRQSVESSQAHLTNVQNKYKVGTVKKTDVLQWEVKLQNDETALNEIENNLNVLLSVWKNLLNTEEELHPAEINIYDYDAEILIYASIDKDRVCAEVEKIIELTRNNNPVLKSFGTTNEMLDKQILLAKGNFLPSLNMQFTYQIENDDEFDFDGDDNWNLVAALSIPIFSGGTNYTNMERTRSTVKESRLNLQSASDNIIIGTKNAYYNLITKAQSVENNRSALESAKENYKLINNLFEQGMITNSDLLDADIMLFAGKMNLVSSYYDFLISKYELKKFTNENQ